MEAAITAVGTANPIHKQRQEIAVEIIANALQLKPAEKRLLKSVYKSTGIETRHSVISDFCKPEHEHTFFPADPNLPFPTTAARMRVYKECALTLALQAIHACFSELSDFNTQEITHLITISCTGMYAPGLDIEIVKQLSLRSDTKRTAINFMGCYGVFNGIRVADAICKADTNAKVLIVSVELCSIHFQKNNSLDNMISNAIFADGAAAVLIETTPRAKRLSLQAFHCDLLPSHSEAMTWHIADSGFDIVLASYVPEVIQSGIAQFTERLLQQQAFQLTDIDFYAIHPGGQKILKACEAALSMTQEQNQYSYQILRDYGNMSSATVLFVLKAIWQTLTHKDTRKTIFSCAFGPGLTLESMLLRAEINA